MRARLLCSIHGSIRPLTSAPLRQGLAERAVGLQGIGQGAFVRERGRRHGRRASTAVRQFEPVRGVLKNYIAELWKEQPSDTTGLELALRAGVDGAYAALKEATFEPSVPPQQRKTCCRFCVNLAARMQSARRCKSFATNSRIRSSWRRSMFCPRMRTLRLPSPSSTSIESPHPNCVGGFATCSSRAQPRPSRSCRRVDAHRIQRDDIPLDQLRRLALHKNEQIDSLVRKYWGNIGLGSSEEKLATMRRFNNDLPPGPVMQSEARCCS